jgi:hypothetical protein
MRIVTVHIGDLRSDVLWLIAAVWISGPVAGLWGADQQARLSISASVAKYCRIFWPLWSAAAAESVSPPRRTRPRSPMLPLFAETQQARNNSRQAAMAQTSKEARKRRGCGAG